jgi:hypothetical protein
MFRVLLLALTIVFSVAVFADDKKDDSHDVVGGAEGTTNNSIYAEKDMACLRCKVKVDGKTQTWKGFVNPGTIVPTAWMSNYILARVLDKKPEDITADDRKGLMEYKVVGKHWDWVRVDESQGHRGIRLVGADYKIGMWTDENSRIVGIDRYTMSYDSANSVWNAKDKTPPQSATAPVPAPVIIKSPPQQC